MNAVATRDTARCTTCERALYVKLTRDEDGAVLRTTYCASCDAQAADPEKAATRRAAFVAAAARLVAGAA